MSFTTDLSSADLRPSATERFGAFLKDDSGNADLLGGAALVGCAALGVAAFFLADIPGRVTEFLAGVKALKLPAAAGGAAPN